MQFLSWLHFSDLHFGMERQEWWWPTFREQFYRDLSILHDQSGPWDVVLFSGDLTQSGHERQFESLKSELTRLWQHFRSLGSAPQFISVPGNHDLMRPTSDSAVLRALRNWNGDEELKNLFWTSDSNEYINFVFSCFENYSVWDSRLDLPTPDKFNAGLLPGDFSATIEKRGLRLGVIGINTAYLQLSDENYEGHLEIHEKQIHTACSNDPASWCKDNHICLLMSHHGPKWLNSNGQQRLIAEIAPPGRLFGHIYGHMHEPYTANLIEMGAEVRRFFQGPSLFGLKTYGLNKERLHGYTAYKVEVEGSNGRLYIWPRSKVQALAGHYRIAPDQRYDLNPNNCIVENFEFKVPGINLNETSPSLITTEEKDAQTVDVPKPLGKESIEIDLIGAKPIEQNKAKAKLLRVPRLHTRGEAPHRAIRQEEQAQLEALLRRDRCAWLISDWGLGQSGFLGCVFERLKTGETYPVVYHLKCENASSPEELLTVFDEQFGLPFQEFFALNSAFQFSVLVLDNIPLGVAEANAAQHGSTFEEYIKSFLDYCPSICIVLISRQIPRHHGFDFVVLKPLELPDVRNYLLSHPDSSHTFQDADIIEKIYMRSGGLPMHLDRIIRMLKITSINDLMDIEFEITTEDSPEPIPKALKQTVATLSQSSNQYSRRSYRLLKLLTVLSYGETLSTVRRFYPAAPLFPDNAFELEELSLLEVIPLFTPTEEIDEYKRGFLLSDAGAAKLLRVPKQVQDYVWSLITQEEYRDIIHRSAEMLFGPKWREGKMKLSQMAKFGMRIAKPLGPGNEHTVALHLLREALQKENDLDVKQAARLCIDYCQKLYDHDRFKDATLAAEEIYHVFLDRDFPKEIIDIAVIYGKSLRMTSKRKEAIEIFELLLNQKKDFMTKDIEANINLVIALAYETDNDASLATAAAERVLSLTEKESARYLHAKSIILGCKETGEDTTKSLSQLERKAHKKDFVVLSNNILLDLVDRTDDVERQLDLTKQILKSSEDNYNHIRAVIKKAEIILKQNSSSDNISQRDRHLLCLAYTHLYYQRLKHLFNRCHNVLWNIMKQENQSNYLLRIFRHSSFLWRILGDIKRENKYLKELDSIDLNGFKRHEVEMLGADLKYLELRRRNQRLSISQS